MIVSVFRNMAAVFLGLAVGFVIVMATEFFGNVTHPFPPDADPSDFETCVAHVARFPAWVLACVIPLWGLACFGSAWTATRLGTNRNWVNGFVVASLLYAAAICNLTMLPYPIWFKVGTALALPLSGFLGSLLARGKTLASPG